MPDLTTLALTLALIAPTESGLTVAAEPAPLHGTLLAPEGQARAVALILPGSGPTDRDGNNPMGVAAAPYRKLAEGLAAQGIASVRFDKRGIGQSAAAAPSEADFTFRDNIGDARLWIDETVARTGLRCVWLIGHSEGALVALATASDDDPKICGLVLLAGAGRKAGVVLREQLASAPLPPDLRTAAETALSELEAGRTTEAPPQLAALFRPSVQPYMISWLALDPATLIAGYDGPVMVGHGSTDLQTTLTDARALAGGQPNAHLVIWDGVNHVLKTAPADRAANLATYGDPSLPLAPGVVEDVAEFILQPR